MVKVSAASLFALDPEVVQSLRSAPELAGADPAARRRYLLTILFGPEMKAFAYAGGHSTTAAETWRNQRGDCLSLSVLSIALARMLNLQAQLQEVHVPASFDRRGRIDFLNAHVNVLLRADGPLHIAGRGQPTHDVLIDFEPRIGSRQRGTPLNDAAVLARFLNNVASQQLALDNDRLAYAHFKAERTGPTPVTATLHSCTCVPGRQPSLLRTFAQRCQRLGWLTAGFARRAPGVRAAMTAR